jgi:hypothetical protein
MSAYSTIRITRSRAKLMTIEYITKHGCHDAMLESFCDEILSERLYHVRIVPDGEENDDDRI